MQPSIILVLRLLAKDPMVKSTQNTWCVSYI